MERTFTGPQDLDAVQHMKACNPRGPLMVHVTKLFPKQVPSSSQGPWTFDSRSETRDLRCFHDACHQARPPAGAVLMIWFLASLTPHFLMLSTQSDSSGVSLHGALVQLYSYRLQGL